MFAVGNQRSRKITVCLMELTWRTPGFVIALRIRNNEDVDLRAIIIEAAGRRAFDYKKLAVESGLPRATVHRYLNGKLDLTGLRLGRLLSALDLVVGKPTKSYKGEVRQVRPRPKALFMMPTATKPVLRYPGSKWKLFQHLVPLIPPHEHYVSLFGGSGADILRKPPSPLETFNDLDHNVTNFFLVLRNHDELQRLKQKLAVTPAVSEQTYKEAHAIIDAGSGDPVDRAWAFVVASHQGFLTQSPSLRTQHGWRHARKPHGISETWLSLPQALDAAADRFKLVQISQQPWEKVLGWSDSPATMFSVDPPYRLADRNDYYNHHMLPEEHQRLLSSLMAVGGFVMLFGFDDLQYRSSLRGWRKLVFRRRTSLRPTGDRPPRFEMVWMNYGQDGARL